MPDPNPSAKNYLGKGRHVVMDNYYNSLNMSKILLNKKTHTTGTLRKNRKGNPKAVTSAKLKKGEHVWRRNGRVYASINGRTIGMVCA